MNSLTKLAALGVLLLGLGIIVGCGNKGELFLPEPGQAPSTATSTDEDEDEQQ